MAVTNAQVLVAVEELKTALEATGLAASSAAERSERTYGVVMNINDFLPYLGGDNTEIIRLLGSFNERLVMLENVQPKQNTLTLKQRWDEFMIKLMGSKSIG